jgi:hypothetical protein
MFLLATVVGESLDDARNKFLCTLVYEYWPIFFDDYRPAIGDTFDINFDQNVATPAEAEQIIKDYMMVGGIGPIWTRS